MENGCTCGRLSRRDLLESPMLLVGAPSLCCSVAEVPPAAVVRSGETVVIDLARTPELRRAGTAARIDDPAGKRNVIVLHASRGRFVALDRTCTHGGGPIAWNPGKKTVQCTCWGHSEFALDGAILGGPAKKPLPVYPTRLEGDRLEIRLGAQA